MSICRLSDPPKSVGKDNLSLRTLAQLCDKIDGVGELLEDFQNACEPVRKHRNKRVGHNDLNTVIKPRDNPLPGIGRSQIDRILELASKILNVIYQNFVDEELYFGHSIVSIGGANELIFLLKIAKQYQAEKRF
jgi:hypothetical protein